jgi:hypothetical protein
VPIDTLIEDTITPYLNGIEGLEWAGSIIDQIWEGLNYVLIDVIFAYLNGDLTSDPTYA